MKVLLPLSIVQTACLLFLTFKLACGAGAGVHGEEIAAAGRAPQLAPGPPAPIYRRADDDRLRQIIREELEHQLGSVVNASNAEADSSQHVHARDQEADRAQKEYVGQKIEYFKSVGAIEDGEMLDLQEAMAKLAPADRKEMLSKLMRALNSSEIRTRWR